MSDITNGTTAAAAAVKPDLTAALTELLAAELHVYPAEADESRMDRVGAAMFAVLRRAAMHPGTHPLRQVVCDALRQDPAAAMEAADDVAFEMRRVTLRDVKNQ